MLTPLRKYAVFAGRAPRGEYWLFVLFLIVATCVTEALDVAFGSGSFTATRYFSPWSAYGYAAASGGWITHVFHLAMLIPMFAVTVRRLHDGNHSGWLLLWALVPGIGWIILLVLYVLKGTPGANRFGPDPIRG